MRRVLISTVLVLSFMLCSCEVVEEVPRITGRVFSDVVDIFVVDEKIPEASRYVAGKSFQGRDIEVVTIGDGPKVVMIMATIHGNEFAGTPIVGRLEKYLQKNPYLLTGKKVVIMPMVNPDGYALKIRYNAKGVDLNRNFPAANRQNNALNGFKGLSEPESQVIYDVINKYEPARIVVFHQPLACIDYDGPGGRLANFMGQYCTLPVKKLGGRPGSLGSYTGIEKGIPIITFELKREDSSLSDEQLWRQYGPATVAAVTYPLRPELLN
jgi:protein MpaA